MIIDEKVFLDLAYEFKTWKEAYLEKGELLPKNDTEKMYWEENINRTLPFTINLGFIDTKFLPNRSSHLPLNAQINNTMSNVTRRLKDKHGFTTKGSSVRIYKDVDSFYCQQCRNIDAIIASK